MWCCFVLQVVVLCYCIVFYSHVAHAASGPWLSAVVSHVCVLSQGHGVHWVACGKAGGATIVPRVGAAVLCCVVLQACVVVLCCWAEGCVVWCTDQLLHSCAVCACVHFRSLGCVSDTWVVCIHVCMCVCVSSTIGIPGVRALGPRRTQAPGRG